MSDTPSQPPVIENSQNVIVLPAGTMNLAAGYFQALAKHTNAPSFPLCVELARLTLTNTGRRYVAPMVQAQEQHDAERQS